MNKHALIRSLDNVLLLSLTYIFPDDCIDPKIASAGFFHGHICLAHNCNEDARRDLLMTVIDVSLLFMCEQNISTPESVPMDIDHAPQSHLTTMNFPQR